MPFVRNYPIKHIGPKQVGDGGAVSGRSIIGELVFQIAVFNTRGYTGLLRPLSVCSIDSSVVYR